MDSYCIDSTLVDETGNENFDLLENDAMPNLRLLSQLYLDIAVRRC
jgi:hypothetical protein